VLATRSVSASEPFRVQFAATYRAQQNVHRGDELVTLQAIGRLLLLADFLVSHSFPEEAEKLKSDVRFSSRLLPTVEAFRLLLISPISELLLLALLA
jgi:hypothetical protein